MKKLISHLWPKKKQSLTTSIGEIQPQGHDLGAATSEKPAKAPKPLKPKGLKRSSIRQKLTLLVLGSVLFSTLPVAGLFIYQEVNREAMARWSLMKTAADVLASSVVEAVQNRDQSKAFASIRAVSRTPGIIYARVETWDGYVLSENGAAARLRSNVLLSADSKAPSLKDMIMTRSIQIVAPVTVGGTKIGQVVVTHRSEGMGRQLKDTLSRIFALAALAIAAALLIVSRMQAAMTRPLADLTRSVGAITLSHDFNQTVETHSNDEVADLVGSFNTMMQAITERDKKIEAQILGLEGEVAARTKDVMQARDEAQAANVAKSDFLATMSHEIRTPMNGVMVMAELLAAESLPPKARRHAETIAKSGRSLLAVINDILDFSKIEAGKLDIELMEVDIIEVIDDCLSLFHAKAKEKGLELVAACHPAAPRMVTVDPVRLGQVISNLISNALKFTETGHVMVRLMPDKGDGFWRLSVSDTGIGIAEENIGKLFSAFTQEDQSTTRRFGGTGLGLSISKRLVEAMGGAITVNSRLHEGTHFHVKLPMPEHSRLAGPESVGDAPKCVQIAIAAPKLSQIISHRFIAAGCQLDELDADLIVVDRHNRASIKAGNAQKLVLLAEAEDTEADQWLKSGRAVAILPLPLRHSELDRLITCLREGTGFAPVSAASHHHAVDASYPRARVLVVDDGEVNREVALEALSRFGIVADIACDGKQAFEAVISKTYDLVLMDGSMPVMDGYEATRHIRDREAKGGLARLPVVGLTAHVVGASANLWQGADMDDVMHKPFTLGDMGRVLGQYLSPDLKEAPIVTEAYVAPEEARVVAPEALIDEGLFDMAVTGPLLEGLKNGRADFVHRVVTLYQKHAPEQITALNHAFAANDDDAIARAAHAIKSMSFNLGAQGVATLAAQIERTVRIDGAKVSRSDIDALVPVLNATLAALGDVSVFSLPRINPQAAPFSMRPEPEAEDPQMALIEEMTADIEAGRFEMVYQPIFDRMGQTIVTAEALIRWQRQGDDAIGPAIFIPLAERCGLITKLGAFARRRVIEQAARWQSVPIAINVSPIELSQPNFIKSLKDLLQETGYDPALLVLEVTETAFIGEPEKTKYILEEIRSMGIKLALDDFGSGYSSLTALHRFPFDKVKIDREFVSALDGEPKSALEALAIIQAVSGIGRAFGLKVVAEGIETMSQHHHLKAAGVHELQGYLFSKPVSGDDFEALLIKAAQIRQSA